MTFVVGLSSAIVRIGIPGRPGCDCDCSDDLCVVDSLLAVEGAIVDGTAVGDLGRDIEPDRDEDVDDGPCGAVVDGCFVDESSLDPDC